MLRPEQLHDIVSLIRDYKKSIGESPLTSDQFFALEKAIMDDRISFFVAWENGVAIGMSSISTMFSTYRCEYTGMFEDFYIKPDYRGKGIARALAQHVFEEMGRRNVNSVLVGCSDSDLEMYTHIGFDVRLGSLLARNND